MTDGVRLFVPAFIVGVVACESATPPAMNAPAATEDRAAREPARKSERDRDGGVDADSDEDPYVEGDEGDDARFAACEQCLSLPEARVCTESGAVAWNACAASACFGSKVRNAGDCGTPPSCTALSGACTYTTGTSAAPCPDGSMWSTNDPGAGCAEGHYEVRCCMPSGLPCSYFGGASFELSVNPFTCAATTSCISGVQQKSCSYAADISDDPMSPPWNAEVTVTAGTNRTVTVTGTDASTGQTFSCTGVVADDFGYAPTTWSCTACAAGGSSCTTCAATHDGLCKL